MTTELFINKQTDTVGDLFLAYGVLQLLVKIAPEALNPTLKDEGWTYRIITDRPIQPDWLEQQQYPITLNHFIQTASDTAIQCPPYIPNPVIYKNEKAINDTWWDAVKKLSGKDRIPQNTRRILDIDPPNPHWSLWALINQQKAIKSYNKIVMIWHQHQGEVFGDLLHIILDLFASPINDVEAAQQAWEHLATEYAIDETVLQTVTQTTSPGLGKGNHRTKANGVVEKNLEMFWLVEYLRFAGLYTAVIPLTIQGSKDRKTYVPIPNQLTWNRASQRVFKVFRDNMIASTAIKLDILAVFRYVEAYLDQWKEAQKVSKGFGLSRGDPADHARAIGVVSMKDMGSSHAIMGMNELNLPRWIQVETIADAVRFQEIIEEHQSVVLSLDETHSDEHSLLRDYRRFLSTGDLFTLLDFARGFGGVIMSRMNDGKYAPQFTLPNLKEVLMAIQAELTPILEDAGFRAIAEAIRRSTVIPQYQKASKRDSTYDIRYGLGDKLMRAANDTGSQRFIYELTEFMHNYNRETAQVAESRHMQFRKAITTADIDSLMKLVDQYQNQKLIAGLLVAYGYARDPEMGKREGQESEGDA